MKLIEKLQMMSAGELAAWHLEARECDTCPYLNGTDVCNAFENKDGKSVYECCLAQTVAYLLSEVEDA